MKLLLDTHTLLWWLDGSDRLSDRAKSAIGDGASRVFVSAASAWEIATKGRMGKLPGATEVAERFTEIIGDQDFDSLPIALEHARRAGLMPGEHRDPFDRILIAQSQIEGLVLVSNEELFDRFGIRRLW